MPQTEVIFYCEADGTAPVKAWLEGLDRKKVLPKCISYIDRLKDFGYMLRRPTAAPLRDGIRELRPTYMNVHYRILYFFHGRTAAIVSHGLVKERRVPPKEIDLAIRRKIEFERNPDSRTHNEA